MNSSLTYLGLDIAKLTLDLSPHPEIPMSHYGNDTAGHRRLITRLRRLTVPVHIICEATGGYEHHLLRALQAASFPVILINPRLARDFARAKGLPWLGASLSQRMAF